MIHLLITDTTPQESRAEHGFGGLPVVPSGVSFAWPHCAVCAGAMQFLARIRVPEEPKLVLIFMCQNDPGCCSEWEADSGGNCALVVETQNLVVVSAPREGVTVRRTEHGVRVEAFDGTDYDVARDEWSNTHEGKRRLIAGQWLGKPSWFQGDQTPNCDHCGNPMRFLAQLEEGADPQTAMNFGGGCAYLFDCACGEHSAKFLWQC